MSTEPVSDLSFRPGGTADWPAIAGLLAANQLPLEGAEAHLSHFQLAIAGDGSIAGVAAIEPYGNTGLLRSVAVVDRHRGVGRALVLHMIEAALASGMTQLVLLTTTAADYFPRFGFRRIERNNTPEAVRASVEFQGACPATAVVMVVNL